ncbi:MAG: hypothetical protein EBS38_02620 [Actinobacteria bacterium]|nr:hypothetical protein [Actinomycetota bacterium]
MNIIETKELLEEIAAIDGRKLTPEIVAAWQGILAGIPLEIAKEAHKLARRDERVNWLEPRHISGWAKEAAFRLDREKPKQVEPQTFAPQPVCKAHNTPILACDPCCHRIYKYKELQGSEKMHEFAKREIYA